jgi:hypothetical protein
MMHAIATGWEQSRKHSKLDFKWGTGKQILSTLSDYSYGPRKTGYNKENEDPLWPLNFRVGTLHAKAAE